MDTPQIDFTQPMTFQNAMQHFALSLAFVMVALRDEAAFREDRDDAILNATHLLCAMLEDSHREATQLARGMEGRGR